MLRYLKAVQLMKKIIEENNLTVMATIARYACAYESIAKPDWWDKSKRSDFGRSSEFSSLNFLLLVLALSLNKAHTFAIFLAILVERLISLP